MRCALLAVVALMSLPFAALHGQYATPYGPVEGSRVRVTAPAYADEALTGRLLAFAGDSLLLGANAGHARARLAAGEIRRVEVSDGHDRWLWATYAGAAGAGLGGVIGAASLAPHDPLGGLVGFLAGMILGAPIGGIVGAVMAPEAWHDDLTGAAVGGSSGAYRLAVDPRTDVRFASRTEPSRLVGGEVALVAGDTMFLVPGSSRGTRSVRLSELAALQVRGGRDRQRGVLYGAAAFALVTAVAGGIDHAHGAISTGDLVSATLGNTLIGGFVGYAFAPAGWEPLALPRR